MGTNRVLCKAPIDYEKVRLTGGDLEGLNSLEIGDSGSVGIIAVDWVDTCSSSGADLDVVSAKVYAPTRNYVYSSSGIVNRQDGTIDLSIPGLADLHTLYIYVQVMRQDGSLWSTTQELTYTV